MNMHDSRPPAGFPENLIATLADDLAPVRVLRQRDGMARAVLALVVAVALVFALFGLRRGLMEGSASVFFLLANGVLVVLGLAAASATVAMANPRVGGHHGGPRWAMAVAAVMPLAALVLAGSGWRALFDPAEGIYCTLYGTATALVVAVPLLLWLRRGAPVAPGRAGVWLGVAAGALGSAAYGLSCPVDTLYHLAIWHFLPVLFAGIVGRVAVPPLIRW